ncbi:hypothetical protein Glove_158g63 [Diversispora epigaea]|uniref:SWIRM domain-containing protein n=1 Tax=Diversispora epigaea TaxID=1348612 RepID=A0A397IRL3_9GLOM|nr:hypothetical protein Glove_158g63 [Diversispora epigaea]
MSSQNLSYNTLFISPPLSPHYKGGIDNSLCDNTQNLSHEEPNNSSQNSTITNPKINNQTQNKPKSIYRFRLKDAPKELLELMNFSSKTLSGNSVKTSVIIGNTNYINGPFSADTTDTNNDRVTVATQNSLNLNTDNKKKINNFNNTDNKISQNVVEKRQRVRKNPYPKKSPSKISPGITCSVDIFKAYRENPKSYLNSIYPLPKKPDPLFSDELFPCSDSETNTTKKRKNRSKSNKFKRTPKVNNYNNNNVFERKRKGNSLTRVMADQEVISTMANNVTNNIKNQNRVYQSQMQFEELMANIEKLNLNMDILNNIAPKITWKGQPLPIKHLPYYDSLHLKEALVASTLRLNPLQYLTSKYTLISSALRYTEKSLPFRKSDAQKLLRIDVNKASKLWEFFSQIKWF